MNLKMMIIMIVFFMASSLVCEEVKTMENIKKKVLVVYYSKTGNTKRVAEDIASGLNADIERIIDNKNRSGIMGYVKAGRDAMMERLTEIAQVEKNPANYDLVIIGSPIWGWNMAPAIRTYIVKYKDSFKQFSCFFTADGTKYTKVLKKVEDLTGKKAVAATGFVKNELNPKNNEKYKQSIAEFINLNK